MDKYLVPKTTSVIVKDGGKMSGDDIENNADISIAVKKERVMDDAYLQRRYKFEEYMERGEYDEFHSVVTTCRDEMKELKKKMKSTIDDTVAYETKNSNFQTRTHKYRITESLRAAMENFELALNHVRDAADGAENIWNDVIHDAMDLEDSRNNKNDPEEAIYEMLQKINYDMM